MLNISTTHSDLGIDENFFSNPTIHKYLGQIGTKRYKHMGFFLGPFSIHLFLLDVANVTENLSE